VNKACGLTKETRSWFQTRSLPRDLLEDIAPYPPLYYILLRPVALIGQSEFGLRCSSVAAGVVGVAITYRTGRMLERRRLGLLGALLCALNHFHPWYSQKFRH
jgi:4-amino-4-deoxy-L-arabinose transferase-like glycosyltransferase